MPSSKSQWERVYKDWLADAVCVQTQQRVFECEDHLSLTNYQPARLTCTGVWGVNHWLHNRRVGLNAARAVSRLVVGGQGLRGGDVTASTPVLVTNCCVWCLQRGVKAVESLHHVAFECPEYDELRQEHVVRGIVASRDVGIFLLHRGRWSGVELRALCRFWEGVAARRFRRGGGLNRRRETQFEIAMRFWVD